MAAVMYDLSSGLLQKMLGDLEVFLLWVLKAVKSQDQTAPRDTPPCCYVPLQPTKRVIFVVTHPA